MNEFKPTVTITLKEYDRLRNFEETFSVNNKEVVEVLRSFALEDFECDQSRFFQIKRRAYQLLETEYFKKIAPKDTLK